MEIDYKNFSPFLQAGFVFLAMVMFIGMGMVTSDNPLFPWICVCAMMLFYALLNTVMSIPHKDLGNYWWKSIVGYVFLAGIGGLVAYGASGLSIDDAGSTRWLYVVFSIGYLVFISIIQLIKLIVSLAQKQDKMVHGNKE